MNELVSIAAERSLIALLLLNSHLCDRVKATIEPKDFSDSALSYIYEIMIRMSDSEHHWTWEKVADALKSDSKRPKVLETAYGYIAQLIALVPSVSQLDFYIEQVSEKRKRNKIDTMLADVRARVADPAASIRDIYTSLREIDTVFDDAGVRQIRSVSPKNLWPSLKEDLEKIYKTKFVGTGYNSIDRYLSWGFAPGMISAIAGRPSMGKSAFRANIEDFLARNGIFVITISKEQSIFREYMRRIAIRSGINLQEAIDVKSWESRGHDKIILQNIKDMSDAVNYQHRIIEPVGLYFLNDVRKAIIDSINANENPQVVFIDLFTLLDDIATQLGKGFDAGIIEKTVNKTMVMSKELNVHICMVTQFKRSGVNREKYDPRELFKGSGVFEERTDLAFQIERPAYYKPDEIEDNHLIIKILKQKDGPTANIKLAWNRMSLKISDIGDQGTHEEKSEAEDYLNNDF